MRMASPVPSPKNWMKLTWLVPKAKKLTASSAAAVETIRPERARPCTTASELDAPASCSSLIRLIRKTSYRCRERPRSAP